MPKYLIHGSYTKEGLNGLLNEGGTKRRDAAERLLASVGGTVEAYYFAFGEHDFYLVADMPDNVTATACSLIGNASGTITANAVVLITPEEVDEAIKKTVDFRPAGH